MCSAVTFARTSVPGTAAHLQLRSTYSARKRFHARRESMPLPDSQVDPLELLSEPGPPEASDSLDESLFLPSLEWLSALDETEFRRLFRGSAIKRTKWRGIVRNACIRSE